MHQNNSHCRPSLSPALLAILLAFFFCISAIGSYLFVDVCIGGPRSIVGKLVQREYSYEEMVDATDRVTNHLFPNLNKPASDGSFEAEENGLVVQKVNNQNGQVLNRVIFKLPPNEIQ